ncbi:hypothetical protein D9757_009279 [Collybiopsis confluens]|uniref:Carrier domain-containing protein n=1 Tax=Collybiopsis confluens TaxID=2823264 RepID=A0A8H5M3M1_9AGAR|nr:hypothetical protein D9757_009279 [Collybiopsis confluens]
MDFALKDPSPYPTLVELILEQILQRPSQSAVIQEECHITFSQLDLYARIVAHQLSSHSLANEDVVGLLTSQGAQHIIGQVGILYAGGTVLPLDPTLTDDEIQMRLKAANVKYLISDSRHHGRHTVAHDLVLTGGVSDGLVPWATQWLGEIPFPLLAKFPLKLAHDHRSHIFFTTGTTGVPKAVQVLARGIARLQNFWNSDTQTRDGPQSVGHINSVGFDISLLDIWGALISGCTITVLDRELCLNPDWLASTLKQKAITAMFFSSSLFSIVSRANPTAFSSLDCLFVGGEAPSLLAVETVLRNGPPNHLFNAYGPTECSILATTHELTLCDVNQGRLPLGRPLNDTEVFVLNEKLEEIVGEGSGELALGGIGLARGYLNDVANTSKAFICIPDKRVPGTTMTLYRTGDLVQRYENGDIVWRARLNNEVKIHGYRVNLGIVEETLINTGLLMSAAVVKLLSADGLTASLVAGVTFKDCNTDYSQLLLMKARKVLPHYMVPQVVSLASLPVNRNGKTDRKELEKLLLKAHDITPDSNFFLLGATSLNVASLTILAREVLGVSLSARAVYERPTLEQLASHIDRVIGGDVLNDIEKSKQQWQSDARLAEALVLPDGHCPDWTSEGEGRIFLTGATGFVAAHLLHQLLLLPAVQGIKCLVRAKSPEHGSQRILENLIKYGIQVSEYQSSKIIPVLGDLSHPTFGLKDHAFEDLGRWTSIIFHLGAQVNYNQPYTVHRPANVLGTLHILKLLVTGRPKGLQYISSIAAVGPTGLLKRNAVSEEEPIDDYIDCLVYENGYAQSQWVADMIMQSLIRRKFPIAVHRLGFVLCHSETGIGNRDDFMSRLVTDCINLGAYPLLPNQRKELLPVDYAVTAILAISSSTRNLGRIFHITPDYESTSLDMLDVFREIQSLLDIPLVGLPYHQWLAQLQLRGMAKDLRTAPLMPMLTEKVYGDKTRWEIYEFMAKFRTDNTREALIAAQLGELIGKSAMDRNTLARYLAFIQQNGE